jgi:hypothetical protein
VRDRSAPAQYTALWGKAATPPPPAQLRQRALEDRTLRPVAAGGCHTSATRPAFRSALLCAACLCGCRQSEKRAHTGTGYHHKVQPPLGHVRRTSDAPQKAQLLAPGVSGKRALQPEDLQNGSQASGCPAVASVQAPPRVRSRTASLTADRNMPAWLRAGHCGYPWLPG